MGVVSAIKSISDGGPMAFKMAKDQISNGKKEEQAKDVITKKKPLSMLNQTADLDKNSMLG